MQLEDPRKAHLQGSISFDGQCVDRPRFLEADLELIPHTGAGVSYGFDNKSLRAF